MGSCSNGSLYFSASHEQQIICNYLFAKGLINISNTLKMYQYATEHFNRQFDVHWNDALIILDSNQSQLVVGSRLRPQISLWGYLSTIPIEELNNHDFDNIAHITVSIELIHKASLLLDDWIDGDEQRHGKPAFHTEYGSRYAVLLALNMIGFAMIRLEKAFPDSLILPHHYHLCLNTLVKTIYSMARGALDELKLQGDDFFDKAKVREIAQLETSEIIGNSMLLGYYAGAGNRRDKKFEVVFKKLGDQCGYLFQSMNDLEAFENPQGLVSHKGRLNYDFLARRKNLAIAALYEIAGKSDRDAIKYASEEELLYLMKKYRVVESLKSELDNLFLDILSTGAILKSMGLPEEWCDGLQCFLGQVKKHAEIRFQE